MSSVSKVKYVLRIEDNKRDLRDYFVIPIGKKLIAGAIIQLSIVIMKC